MHPALINPFAAPVAPNAVPKPRRIAKHPALFAPYGKPVKKPARKPRKA